MLRSMLTSVRNVPFNGVFKRLLAPIKPTTNVKRSSQWSPATHPSMARRWQQWNVYVCNRQTAMRRYVVVASRPLESSYWQCTDTLHSPSMSSRGPCLRSQTSPATAPVSQLFHPLLLGTSVFFCFQLLLLWSPYGIGQTIIFPSCRLSYLSFFFFSWPNLSRRRLDVCHTSTHGVALARI